MRLEANSLFIGFVVGVALTFIICTMIYYERIDDIVNTGRLVYDNITYQVTIKEDSYARNN